LFTSGGLGLKNLVLFTSLVINVQTAIFQDSLVEPVPECLHSGFYWS